MGLKTTAVLTTSHPSLIISLFSYAKMSGWSVLRRFSLGKSRKKPLNEAESSANHTEMPISGTPIPETQRVLLLRGPKQEYQLVDSYPVPKLASEDEILVRNLAIGLNPIDWKAP